MPTKRPLKRIAYYVSTKDLIPNLQKKGFCINPNLTAWYTEKDVLTKVDYLKNFILLLFKKDNFLTKEETLKREKNETLKNHFCSVLELTSLDVKLYHNKKSFFLFVENKE